MHRLIATILVMLASTAWAEPSAIRLTDWIAGQANQTLEVDLGRRFSVNQPSLYTLPDFPFTIEGRGDHIALISTEYNVVMAIKEDVSWPKSISLNYEPEEGALLRLQTPSVDEYEAASAAGTSLVGQGTLSWQVDVTKQRFTSIEELDAFIEDAARNVNITDLRWDRYGLNQLYRKWVQSP
ncbi:hypothetical protein [Salinibius halmophilus]|uniref:hypothetical protein n=1 Tax=Salinibius halmophilus TaxID=1853216 RepID=UPI000E66848A|nr:hypothetical protein [Salinibius halmophilus]